MVWTNSIFSYKSTSRNNSTYCVQFGEAEDVGGAVDISIIRQVYLDLGYSIAVKNFTAFRAQDASGLSLCAWAGAKTCIHVEPTKNL